MKNKIENAFKKFYPNKRLLASLINDMYITIGFDDGTKEGEIEQEHFDFGSKNFEGQMDKVKDEVGVGAYTYGHTCGNHTWIQPGER